jgi:membrane protein
MIAAAVRFGQSWLARFVAVQGVDRAMALAAQAFSALIPLLIVYSAVVSRGEGQNLADAIIERFELTGAAAASVRQAFTSSETVTDSISVLGVLLVLISALSFSRGMQRLYETTYGLPTLGMRNTKRALGWLGVVVIYLTVRPPIAGISENDWVRAVASLGLAGALWAATPYLLLGRRMPWRPLLPAALLVAIGMSILGATSVIWFPRTLASSADQFGVIGVAFALLSWLVAWGFVLVIATAGGAVIAERIGGRFATFSPRRPE